MSGDVDRGEWMAMVLVVGTSMTAGSLIVHVAIALHSGRALVGDGLMVPAIFMGITAFYLLVAPSDDP